ncbi:hypothetical protein E4T56_gene15140, partial [Termitomyces sp. T112]
DDDDEVDDIGSLSQSAEALRITAAAPAPEEHRLFRGLLLWGSHLWQCLFGNHGVGGKVHPMDAETSSA